MRAATFSIRPSCPTLTWWSSLTFDAHGFWARAL
jgi:hypothetical protein